MVWIMTNFMGVVGVETGGNFELPVNNKIH